MKSAGHFAEIILPLPVRGVFTYTVPEEMIPLVVPGKRVIVQFGARKMYTGLIRKLHNSDPAQQELKPLLEILDEIPLVNEYQMKFWEWMADYYMCTLGEVFKAALPSGLKLESESRVLPNEDFDALSLKKEHLELLFLTIRENPGLSIHELTKKTSRPALISDIRKLIDQDAIFLEEKMRNTLRVKKEKFISLSENLKDEKRLQNVLDELSPAPRQLELLTEIVNLSMDKKGRLSLKEVPMSEFMKSQSPSALKALLDKNILVKTERVVDADEMPDGKLIQPARLNPAQEAALGNIHKLFREKDVVLLHGVTSSGKTEVYIHLIQEMIDQGKEVLYLLPEIALSSQIINRLRKVFGDQVGIYHSRFSDAERVEVYRRTAGQKGQRYKVILGVRSAVFLPFSNLGLIIVDEEHENTYKQFDPAPRYNARDSSMVLAGIHGAKVLLGTATPSIESYANASSGKYGLVELSQRFNEVLMPEIRIADIRDARKRKSMKSVFTPVLIDSIFETVAAGKQVILFQNRRGFSSYIMDETCGWIPRCKQCDVSLTYHKFRNSLECHYCGYVRKVPAHCEECGSTRLTNKGFGTELVEDDINLIFPGIRVARLDLDTSRAANSYEKILESFGRQEIDILVGTQMLSKGLDFENVALVGILDADQMLNFPDFRAYERSYQLMAQVSGRAGRKDKQGKVIIQTLDPAISLIHYVRKNDYQAMFREQIMERQAFNYPPFVRMIRISLKHKDASLLQKAAGLLSDEMRIVFGRRVLGPQAPLVGRISSYYVLQIILKVEKKSSFERARKLLADIIREASGADIMSGVKIQPDVDPY
ncbi:MAG: primosomal protein N' [Bacteroidales bacterium]|nr:primosomal protein N' [Bacteroidales bacterium]MCB8998659.1 primosomal protein N' [Bacteroidales bacterium]